MRRSTVIFVIGLWLLALINMWLVMRMGDEHARTVARHIRPGAGNEPPQSGHVVFIVNAPPDTPTQTSGPSIRPTPKHPRR
jgi:hypothetical protein